MFCSLDLTEIVEKLWKNFLKNCWKMVTLAVSSNILEIKGNTVTGL